METRNGLSIVPTGVWAAIQYLDTLQYKGAIDCSTNPNYLAADAGHTYIVSVAGKIGGASGTVVTAGDFFLCKTDGTAAGDQATVGAQWNILEKNIDLTNISISGGAINGTPIGGTTAGTIRSLIDEDVEAASDTLTANQCSGGLINNFGQDAANADITITLPVIAAGYNFTVVLGDTQANFYRIDPNANDSIYLDGVTTGDGKYVQIASAVKGACIQFFAFQTAAAAWDWLALTVSGAWTAEA